MTIQSAVIANVESIAGDVCDDARRVGGVVSGR
jgi:hypothetical protein